jgi:hypothetical protein
MPDHKSINTMRHCLHKERVLKSRKVVEEAWHGAISVTDRSSMPASPYYPIHFNTQMVYLKGERWSCSMASSIITIDSQTERVCGKAGF